MKSRGHRHDRGLDTGLNQGRHIRKHLQFPRHPELVTGRIRYGDEGFAGSLADVADVVSTHATNTDYTNTYFFHNLPICFEFRLKRSPGPFLNASTPPRGAPMLTHRRRAGI